MRAIVALIILVLGIGGALPETEYTALIGAPRQADGDSALIDIESSIGRADRLNVAALQESEPQQAAPAPEIPDLDETVLPLHFAPVDADSAPPQPTDVPLGDLCNALLTSAEDNHLPVPFLANLIWQESRLRNDAVSRVGALGIAQFMPRTAAETGLSDPFNPLQAIPASARLLRELRDQLGNLGYAAAAYNAGPGRVAEWLEHRRELPRETRNYVVRVTGRSADEWRKTPPDDDELRFVRRLPCRDLPAFADLEQEQQAQQETAKQAQAATTPVQASAPAVNTEQLAQQHDAEFRHPRVRVQWRVVHLAVNSGREATRRHLWHQRYRSAEGRHAGLHRA